MGCPWWVLCSCYFLYGGVKYLRWPVSPQSGHIFLGLFYFLLFIFLLLFYFNVGSLAFCLKRKEKKRRRRRRKEMMFG
jgi:hypothetical protein